MRPFALDRAPDLRTALGAGGAAAYLAGGTTMLDLMKLDVLHPARLLDINALRREHGAIRADASGLHLGALARMSAVADHPDVRGDFPMLSEALWQAASPQLRNMASLGGNVMQRTRCGYFRDASVSACNKRVPGSGCAAIAGANRLQAVLGVSEHCIASYPGDFAVALAALDAQVELAGPQATRRIPFASLHREPGDTPEMETNLGPGELITGFHVPAGPCARRSLYLKVRDRESYAFALASAAIGLHLDGDRVMQSRIGLGGLATRPWRSHAAEAALAGRILDEGTAREAAEAAFANARTHGGNDFKPELGRRTLVRALLAAARKEA